MSLKYACFISYRHREQNELLDIIRQIRDELAVQLAQSIDEEPYRDNLLQPGQHYNEAFAEALCHSACLVAVYNPVYSESDYCRREWEAMKRIEDKRRALLGNRADRTMGMIIPVVIKWHTKDPYHEKEWLPPQIKGGIEYCDISRLVLRSTKKLREYKEFRDKMRVVADYVVGVRAMLAQDQEICCGCSAFSLPPAADPWTDTFTPAFPLR
ncbi:MAG: toll/interleukin-1 receptor domain-containing protein [Bryobacteraceae bacterium]